ncbi:MAG TPA: M14 family zinc carboxypeptidase [Thermoanaerobaculia bacterium]|nr:M14 family zinc carboxypeptidase [Thermoanaerobaculia bacterium]
MKLTPMLILALVLFVPGVASSTEPLEKHPEWDQGYSRKIRDFTTGPEFMTDLVDHLPLSDKVPTPEKFNGYVAGAPDHLTYAEDVHRYMRALEAASPRLKVFSIGKSEEGREMILVAIADEETIHRLDSYKEITGKLADPRKLSEDEAAQLVKTGKPMYYLTGAMHSPETGSPEMLMELAYRLVVEETPLVRGIRENVITLITPVLEVDGRDRMVDLARWHQAHPKSALPPLMYWGHYAAHDNNRDAMGIGLNLTRNVLGAYFAWHPQVLHDLHESIPFLYISTGTGPYNPALDPIAIDEWHRMAYNEVQTLTEKGLVGVWTHGFYDGWAPNYMFWIAHGHNSIGRFYETFGNLLPSTEDRVVRAQSQRDWFRPNPPYPKVRWSLRNNVNYQQSGVLVALKYMADNREHMLQTFWTLARRSIAKASTEGPAAYVFPGDQKRLGQLRDLLNLLRSMGIEIQQADQAFTIKPGWPPRPQLSPVAALPAGRKRDDEKGTAEHKDGEKAGKETAKQPAKDAKPEKEEIAFAAGSFVIRLDQPYSRLADALFDTQYVLGQERVYDDTGWTLSYTKNVDCKRIVNRDVLKVPMHPWDGRLKPHEAAARGRAIAISNNADTDLVRLRYELADVKFAVLEGDLKRNSGTLPAGTIVVEASDRVQKAIASAGSLKYEVLDAWPAVKTHEMPLPRIAILHTWLNTQEEGWFRLAFDSLQVPYAYISTQQVAGIADLHSKYDAIVFPPAGGEPTDIVNGMPPGAPLPWKKTELTPNLGVDETDDMRPGLGLAGVASLQRFVEDGGLLIAVRDAAAWAVQYGLARHVRVTPSEKLKARGSILQARLVDAKSPVGYGYDEMVPIQYAGSPIFKIGDRAEAPGNRRPSGRGSATDPDVPQGRSYVEPPERPKPGPGEEGFQPPEDFAVFAEPYIPRIQDRPRVILSFPKETDKILLSGMLEGAEEIAGSPVVIDSPLGKGHILLFANNPMWRMNTQGDFALVFNAIFNAGSLGLGWPPEAPAAAAGK